MSNLVKTLSVFLVAILIGTGCVSKLPPAQENIMQKEYHGAPDWVVKGCNTYGKTESSKEIICGVGSAEGTQDPAITREIALVRAQADIAKKMQVTITSILKDYRATTIRGEGSGTDTIDEQYIEILTKEITDMNLSGIETIDSWKSSRGTYYVLVALNAEKFKGNIKKMDNLSPPIRNTILEQADKAFQELDSGIQ
jgi:hypothetical protein